MSKFTLLIASSLLITNFAYASQLSVPNSFSSNTPAVADEVNGNFTSVQDAVNDNDTRLTAVESTLNSTTATATTNAAGVNSNATSISTNSDDITSANTAISDNAGNISANLANIDANDGRISDLESASPAMGRIMLPVANPNSNFFTNLEETGTTSSAYSTTFTKPHDYVSGNFTVKALVSGCAGTNARVTLNKITNKIGLNGLAFGTPATQTISIPTAGFLQYHIVAVSGTFSSFADLNYMYLSRTPADAADTCTSNLTVRGFLLEYPRG